MYGRSMPQYWCPSIGDRPALFAPAPLRAPPENCLGPLHLTVCLAHPAGTVWRPSSKLSGTPLFETVWDGVSFETVWDGVS